MEEPGQPIPSERLRELYTARLEVLVAQSELQTHVRQVQAIEQGYQALIAGLEKEFAVDFKDYTFDLKGGKMTRTATNLRAVQRRGERKAKG